MELTRKQEEGLKIAVERHRMGEKIYCYCWVCRFENSFGQSLRN